MSDGYHKCAYCGEWHGCGKPRSGCVAFLLGVVLFVLLSPLLLVLAETWTIAICDKWPNLGKGCQITPSFVNPKSNPTPAKE
jgi:hypothetical protein